MTPDLSTVMPTKKRKAWPWIAAAVAVLLVAGGAAYPLWPTSSAPAAGTITITGTLTLTGNNNGDSGQSYCAGLGGFEDIKQGAQITVTDAAGIVVALGSLGQGVPAWPACQFAFKVTGVPEGKGFYGIEVTHRGRVQYAETVLDQPVALTLG